MSQSTIAAARQNEMNTSIAVVTTMICGRASVVAGALCSGVATRKASGGGRAPEETAILLFAQNLEQLGLALRVEQPGPAASAAEQPRHAGQRLQVVPGLALRPGKEKDEARRLAVE